jgi:hypothetical protein
MTFLLCVVLDAFDIFDVLEVVRQKGEADLWAAC